MHLGSNCFKPNNNNCFIFEGQDVPLLGLGHLLIPQDSSGDSELSIAGQRTEEERPEAILLQGRQSHAEDTFLKPLEVESSDVEVTCAWGRGRYN